METWRDAPRFVTIDRSAEQLFKFTCQAILDHMKRTGLEWFEIKPDLQKEISA